MQQVPGQPERRAGHPLRQHRHGRQVRGRKRRQDQSRHCQRRHAAAISSHPCAALYGLEAVRDDIQDSDNNYTRFICITKDPVIYAGANRISLIIACDNKPGALYDILSKLAALGINMTKLESCPVTGRNFEFIFFLELEASVHEPGVLPMLEELERSCQNFQFLGNYAEV